MGFFSCWTVFRIIVNICISIFQCICWIQTEFWLYIFGDFLCLDIRHLVFMQGYSIETTPSREPVISSRPGTGTEMLCCANVISPMCERAKVENQTRNSHGLSIIYLLKDHHASRDSLWMLKYCPSSGCFRRVCGFGWFTFPESEHKSAGSTKKPLAGIDFQNLLFLQFSTLSIPAWVEGCCSRLALPGCTQLAPRFCRPRRCELGDHQEWAGHL